MGCQNPLRKTLQRHMLLKCLNQQFQRYRNPRCLLSPKSQQCLNYRSPQSQRSPSLQCLVIQPKGLRCCSSFFNPKKASSKISNIDQLLREVEERKRMANVMQDGFSFLLAGDVNHNSIQHGLLGLKVIIEMEHDRIQEFFTENSVAIHDNKLRTYEMKAQDAVELLSDYVEFWIHSCSIVLSKTTLSALHGRIHQSSYQCGREPTFNHQFSMDCSEVMMFVRTNGDIDDEGISNKMQLVKFLEENEEKMLRVHATCSRITILKEDNQNDSHFVIPKLLE